MALFGGDLDDWTGTASVREEALKTYGKPFFYVGVQQI